MQIRHAPCYDAHGGLSVNPSIERSCLSGRVPLAMAAVLIGAWACSAGPTQGLDARLPHEAVDSSSYNVSFTLRGNETPATVKAVLGLKADGTHYEVSFGAKGTEVCKVAGGRVLRVSAASQSCIGSRDKGARITLKCRPHELVVEVDRRALLRTYPEDDLGGEVGFARTESKVAVEDFRLQEIADLYFADEFFPSRERSDTWTAVKGEWRIGVTRDPMLGGETDHIGASWYEAVPASECLSVTGFPFWEDYSLSVSARLSDRTTTGLVFYYHDAENYCQFRLRPGGSKAKATAEIVTVVGGQPQVQDREEVSYRPGQWHRLRVDTQGEFARAVVNDTEVVRGLVPGLADGQVGLYASGDGAVRFDDVEVRGLTMMAEGQVPFDLARWQAVAGKWQTDGGGRLLAAKGDALALVRAQPVKDFACRVKFRPQEDGSSGIVFGYQDKGDHYFLRTLAPGSFELGRVLNGKPVTLARTAAKAPGSQSHVMEVARRWGGIKWRVDASPWQTVYDFSMASGRLGFCASGKGGAAFQELIVVPYEDTTSTRVFVADFASPVFKGRNEEEQRPVVGYLLQPSSGYWRVGEVGGEGCLVGTASPSSASSAVACVWPRGGNPGDARIEFDLLPLTSGKAAGAILASQSRSSEEGYRLTVSGGNQASVSLLRAGKVVARATGPWATAGWTPTRFFRDGRWVVAQVGEAAAVAFHDDQPLTGSEVGLWCSGDNIAFDNLALLNDEGVGSAFDRVSTDWYATSGGWELHSGMACIPWSHWIACDARQEEALYWNRHPMPADVEVTFDVSEHSEGDESGYHRHFPYHDIRVVISGDGEKADSGYSFLIGKGGGRGIALARAGQVVAEAPYFTIAMVGHCNMPRSIHVVVRKVGGHLELWCNQSKMIEYEDLKPLGGGYIGLGASGCRANFSDFLAVVMRPWLLAQ